MAAKTKEPELKTISYEELEKYSNHPIANINPMLSSKQLLVLKKDLEDNKQQLPIIVYKTTIIDGRNRAKALIDLKEESINIVEVSSIDEARKLSNSHNDMRRHLSKSQYAMIAAQDIMKTRESTDGKKIPKSKWKKVEDAKEVLEEKTSKRLVENALRVIKLKDIADKVEDVLTGLLTISEALNEINIEKNKIKPKEEVVDKNEVELRGNSDEAVDEYKKLIDDKTMTRGNLAKELVELRLKLKELEQ